MRKRKDFFHSIRTHYTAAPGCPSSTECLSFSVSSVQAPSGFMFLALLSHSVFLFSDGTDSNSQTVLEDNFCIFGGMLWQAEFLRSDSLPVGWYYAVSNVFLNFDSLASCFKEKTEPWRTLALQWKCQLLVYGIRQTIKQFVHTNWKEAYCIACLQSRLF